MARRLMGCLERLQQVARELATISATSKPPAFVTIFNELSAIAEEFEGFAVDLTNQTISVTTDRVVLEDTDLGPFEIRLHWKRIGERRCYEVVALEPHAACESSDVTHPHVRSRQLFEGDGQEVIRRALLSGRLTDFFQIVTQILNTYNGGSAYVSLSEWQGIACDDCARFVSEDDKSICERCDRDLCLDCLESCAGCEYRFCHACTDQCRSCDCRVCPSCCRSCDRCDGVFCAPCLSKNDLCGECQEQDDAKHFDEDENRPVEIAALVTPPTGDSCPVPSADTAAL